MPQSIRRWCETGLLTLLAFVILWKGGKSLESTWLFAGAASGLVLVQAFALKKGTAVPRLLWWCTMGFVLWTAAAFALSATRNYGFDEVLQTAAFAFLLCWTVREQSQAEDGLFARRVIRIIAFAAYVACFIGVLVYIFQPVSRFVGSFFDHRFHTDYWPNAWAEFALLTWPLVVWALFSPEAGWRRDVFAPRHVVLNWLVAGFFIGCLLLSYSRGAGIALLGQMAAAVGLLLWTMPRRVRWGQVIVSSLSVLFFALVWFSAINIVRSHFYPVESVIRKATFSSAEGGSSTSERLQFWSQAALLAKERPQFGWGPYSFRFIQPQLQKEVLATSDHPHSVFLKFALERGWAAAGLFFAIVVCASWRGLRRWLTMARQDRPGAHRHFALLIGAAGVVAHNLIDYNLQFIGILLPFTLVLGILAAAPPPPGGTGRLKRQRLVECVLAVVILLIAAREGWYLAVSSRGRHAEAAGNSALALTEYARAEHALFSRDLFLSEAGLLLDDALLDEAGRALDVYAEVNVVDQRLWKLRGDLAELRKQPAEAVTAYSRAYGLSKFNDIGLAHLLLRAMAGSPSKRTPDIDAWRPELERLLNDFAYAVEQNAHFISLSRNVEGLVETAKLMAALYPERAPEYRALIERVTAKAEADRATYTARPPGVLWRAQ